MRCEVPTVARLTSAVPDQIPGANTWMAQLIVAEIGPDIDRFETASNTAPMN